MKFHLFVLSLFLTISSLLSANAENDTSYTIKWNEIENWIAPMSSVKVLSFDGATYPTGDLLPYFHVEIPAQASYVYDVELINPIYEQLKPNEQLLVAGKINQQKVNVQSSLLNSRGDATLNISFLPLIVEGERLSKLISFDLKITASPAPQKTSKTTFHTYSNNSVLAQGRFVKIRISESGVYRLTFEDLQSMGVNPANVRIFGYGGAMLNQSFLLPKHDDLPEVAIWMEKGADNVFNAGDYILFYAQGVNRWAYDKSRAMFTHELNLYSNHGYYFVTSDAGIGKKIEPKQISVPDGATIVDVDEFVDYRVHEKESINLWNSGKVFYGESFVNGTNLNVNFSFPNIVKASNSARVRMDVAATATASSVFSLTLNGEQTRTLSVQPVTGDFYEKAKGATSVLTYTPVSDAFNMGLRYTTSASSPKGYLNFIEVNVRRSLKMTGSVMPFRNVDNLGANSYSRFKLSDATSNVLVWDITDQLNIVQLPTEQMDDVKVFYASNATENQYLAINPTVASAFPKPEIVGAVPNQNLHALTPTDMVILTHPKFLTQAETLAQAHREMNFLTVAVVTTEQVYNEFSSGAPDATAYRWVMKMLYDRAIESGNTADFPKYLLLFGRGSFDNRNVLDNTGDNYILTYQAENSLVSTSSYVTDDYFGFLEDHEGLSVPSHTVDLGIGRFPVTTVQQASDVVSKTITYMENSRKGNWKNQLCFLADDGDGALHMRQADSIASMVGRLHPSYQINKIYLDAYQQEVSASGQTYPLAKNHFQNLLRSGLFLLNFTGHAGPTGWTNEQILTVSDVRSLTNKHLPVWMAATCDFLQFDGSAVSAGENVVLNPIGGGIGILSAARPVYASQNMTLNKFFAENLFSKVDGNHHRIGDVVRIAKNSIKSDVNKLSYVYLGDPAVRLTYPTDYKIITSKINDSDVQGNDTVSALSRVSIQGFVADENNNVVSGFNGRVHVVVFDKVQRITTLNNDGDGTLTYSDRPNRLFSGKADVVDGEFTVSFILPKDIKYNFGAGRINYYAQDDTNNMEAQGHFENFIIGGTNQTIELEFEGPEVSMYLNSENFVSGGKVNETPMFVAEVSDINGINSIGSGIGHDILLVVNKDPNKSYVLNDYYESLPNSYTDGFVKFILPELPNGKHTLTFRVWDLLNNSTTKTLDFEVVKGLDPVIFEIYNYPNPAKVSTKFAVKHDRPETIMNTTVDIFDLAGRKVWSFSQNTADEIYWDLCGPDSRKVQPGVYLYRVRVNTNGNEVQSKIKKLLVVKE